MSLEIRPLPREPYTIHLVVQWLYSEWGYTLPGNSLEWAIERFTRRALSRRLPTCLVAYLDGVPVGTTSLVDHDLPGFEDRTPWVSGVFVHPDARSHGVGAALLRAAREAWVSWGYSTAYLYTPDRVDFYRKMGWEVLEWRDVLEEKVAIMRYQGVTVEPKPPATCPPRGAVGATGFVSKSRPAFEEERLRAGRGASASPHRLTLVGHPPGS
jgi:GNAT superfamily N-acetyltransferase